MGSESVLISHCAHINERESAPFSVVSILLTENTAEAMRKNYSSDLAGFQWNEITKWIDTERHRHHDLRHHDLRRDLLDGILYLTKTGFDQNRLPMADVARRVRPVADGLLLFPKVERARRDRAYS
jgi:hypothetical protein